MSFTIKYNGADVTERLHLTRCFLYDRYGAMLDSIRLEFPKGSKPFDLYQYDEIEVNLDGYHTGKMYLDTLTLVGESYVADAISFKPIKKKKSSGLWKNIRLLQVAQDIAKKNGLTLKTYGVVNHLYGTLSRNNETDLQFLQRICEREGYSIKCDNGSLIIFNEYELENVAKPLDITPSDVNPSYRFTRSSKGLSSLTVTCYDIVKHIINTFTAYDENMQGGAEMLVVPVTSSGEAERFAKGLLRKANKEYLTAVLPMELRTDISAGTVINLKEFGEYSGRYVVSEVAHDALNDKTNIKCRAILGY